MATENFLARRDALRVLGALALGAALPWSASAAPTSTVSLAAAWKRGDRYQVGWLQWDASATSLRISAALDVPTRAHGVWLDAQGALLVVARRPGDWLLRWSLNEAPQWHWMPTERSLNGHVITHHDGQRLYTTETDTDSGAGLVALRDARTLAVQQEWPTHGRDPHQLLWDEQVPNALVIANGGLETRPESGRLKLNKAAMDSSLVRLDADSGALRGQWRLDDARLSLRHLAWSGAQHHRQLGIALQAEHDDETQRATAPVLAVFDGTRLHAHAAEKVLSGYGGDIAAHENGFAVSCTRAGGVAQFDLDGAWRGFTELPQACALAAGAQMWAGGAPQAARCIEQNHAVVALPEGLVLDNHWVLS